MTATATTDEERNAGTMIAIYYVGKIEGRSPDIDLEEELFQLTQRMTMDEIFAERQRCSAEVQTMGRSLVEMGQNLQVRERDAETQNKS